MTTTRRSTLGGLAAAAAALLPPARSRAGDREARIALATETSSIDPMFHNVTPNNTLARHIFDPLVRMDARLALRPALALSWTAVGDDAWVFRLRPGVRFHDGRPFTADDAVFSLNRVNQVPNSPSSLAMYTAGILGAEALDPLTLRVRTDGPSPLVPTNLPFISMVSRAAAEGRTTEDFNQGTAAIGTGPYKFREWVRGNRIVLDGNAEHWDGPATWSRVTLRPVANGTSRVAALLSGDADLIEGVPASDLPRLQADPRTALAQTDVVVTIYLHLDTARDRSPGVTDRSGAPLDRNPLKDLRVRRAMTIAINREALASRLLEGQARPTGQFLPPGIPGASDKLPVPAFDPAEARRLLAEAGYAQGFGIVLAGSNDRYPHDSEVAQAVAQMLGRVGIAVTVESMPSSMLFSRGSKLDFSFLMAGWVTGTGDVSSPLSALLATSNPEQGMGTSNRGRYSNPEMDRLLYAASRTLDDAGRNATLARATEVALNDVGLIPLYTLVRSWGVRKGFAYEPRMDDMTLAMGLRPSPA